MGLFLAWFSVVPFVLVLTGAFWWLVVNSLSDKWARRVVFTLISVGLISAFIWGVFFLKAYYWGVG